jgi:hypothetical protein
MKVFPPSRWDGVSEKQGDIEIEGEQQDWFNELAQLDG